MFAVELGREVTMEHPKVKSLIDCRPTSSLPSAPKPRLLDEVRQAIRTRHYSYGTEKAYVGWIKRFIFFHNKRHPAEMGEAEVAQFLSALAQESRVSASTQNQALNGLLFLYHEVLGKEIGYVSGVVRAKRPTRLPVVLTREEVKSILSLLHGTEWIMATLLYGAGLRLMECMRLRVKRTKGSEDKRVKSALGSLGLVREKVGSEERSLYLDQPRTTRSGKPAFGARLTPLEATSTS